MSGGERDKQFDEVLGRHVQRHLHDDARENCPDANVLAAYHERSLSPEEMSAWKEHIASCVACQEVLTQLEETDDIFVEEPNFDREKEHVFAAAEIDMVAMAPAPVQEYAAAQPGTPKLRAAATPLSIASAKKDGIAKPLESKKIFRWVAPAGAIAAGLLIYAVVHENRMAKMASSAPIEIAENRREAAPSPPQAPLEMERTNSQSRTQAADQLQTKQNAGENNAPVRQDKLVEQEKALQKQRAQSSRDLSEFTKAAPGVLAGAPKLLRQQKNEAQRMAGSGSAAAAPAFTDSKIAPIAPIAPPPSVVAGNVQPQAPPLPSLTAPVGADAAPAPSAGATEKDAYSAAKESKKDAPLIGSASETVTVQSEVMSRNVAPLKSKFREVFVVSSPDNKSMWRVGSSGALEFSSDRGRSWLPQQTFTAGEYTAGSAPSAKVCWMVGTHGTILLTTNAGHTWKKVFSPLVENLSGVRATDALHATVWDATNSHILATADGGVTWKQAVNE